MLKFFAISVICLVGVVVLADFFKFINRFVYADKNQLDNTTKNLFPHVNLNFTSLKDTQARSTITLFHKLDKILKDLNSYIAQAVTLENGNYRLNNETDGPTGGHHFQFQQILLAIKNTRLFCLEHSPHISQEIGSRSIKMLQFLENNLALGPYTAKHTPSQQILVDYKRLKLTHQRVSLQLEDLRLAIRHEVGKTNMYSNHVYKV